MDPPYSDSSIGNVVTKLANSKLMGKDSVLVVTHSPHLSLDPTYGPLSHLKQRRHGDSFIEVYRKEANP